MNVMHKCDNELNKHKENSSIYDKEGKEKTSRISENKEKARDGYVSMHECGKHLCHSTYERPCT